MKELENLTNAWVSPTGRYVTKHEDFYFDHTWHLELAHCILKDLWKLDSWFDAFERVNKDGRLGHNAIEELEEMGWIRLHGFGGLIPVWIVPVGRKLTKKQEESILDWCMVNNRNYDTSFAK